MKSLLRIYYIVFLVLTGPKLATAADNPSVPVTGANEKFYDFTDSKYFANPVTDNTGGFAPRTHQMVYDSEPARGYSFGADIRLCTPYTMVSRDLSNPQSDPPATWTVKDCQGIEGLRGADSISIQVQPQRATEPLFNYDTIDLDLAVPTPNLLDNWLAAHPSSNTPFGLELSFIQYNSQTPLLCESSLPMTVTRSDISLPNLQIFYNFPLDFQGNSRQLRIKCNQPIGSVNLTKINFSNSPGSGLGATDSYVLAKSIKLSSDDVLTDLSVTSVDLAQVVYNPQNNPSTNERFVYTPLVPQKSDNLIAVLGKSASFSPTVKLTNSRGKVPTGNYQVQIKDRNGLIISQSEILSTNTLAATGTYIISPEKMVPLSPLKSYIPNIAGANTLKATVVASDSTVKNSPKNFSLTAIKTYAPSIGLVRISPTNLSDYKGTDETSFSKFISLSSYISDVLPVSNNSINLQGSGVLNGEPYPSGSHLIDVKNLDIMRRFHGLSRMALIADSTYFRATGKDLDTVGYHYTTFNKVAVIQSTDLSTLPHELGHSFGIHYELYENQYNEFPHNFDGFNANPNGYLSRNKLFDGASSFMDSSSEMATTNNMPWIDDRSYSIMFNYLQNQEIDPETILISGVINKNDTISNIESYNLSNGVLTPSENNGNLKIMSLDINNNKLSSISINTSFTMEVVRRTRTSRSGTINVDSIPFAIEIPDDPRITNIQISNNNKVLAKFSLNSLILTGIIKRIPLEAFKAIGCINPKEKK